MTDAWDGRPENPERDGWHWVRVNLAPAYQPEPWFWDATSQAFALDDRDDDWFPQHYDYLGPALLPAQVAAAVEAERKAIADEHDCGCAARIDVLRMLSSGAPWRAKNFCPAAPNCCAIDAAAIRVGRRALADALRQAEARGMREAAMHALSAVPQPLVGDAGHCTISTRDICTAAILAAADAKEKPDAE